MCKLLWKQLTQPENPKIAPNIPILQTIDDGKNPAPPYMYETL